MSKPWVFNYDHFRELEQKYADLLIKHVHLQAENTNLKIKCRILEADLKALQKEEQK